jgi:CHASE2 domain-containing sensor protein
MMRSMSEIDRRPPSPLSRRQREQRAYRLVVATGVLSAIAVIGLVLALVGVVGGGIPVVAAILAIVCFVMLRRTVGAR